MTDKEYSRLQLACKIINSVSNDTVIQATYGVGDYGTDGTGTNSVHRHVSNIVLSQVWTGFGRDVNKTIYDLARAELAQYQKQVMYDM